ncbi:hypothetical protein L1987_08984 [Smallanthus sonchifolius]|uniref:Uncharacterized protein n=1 Tax=Smallanthus sonchifolius TaxID=185202 RepID=A0ACB9JNV9_9ASTR|nr:hypothetical protein L1987_08984 [Smallanthus sonchifolius]
MKLYDGTTYPEERIAQYRERMEIIPISLHLKEACLCKGFRDYISRFGRESLDIPNIDVATAVQAFKMGLKRESPFYEDLEMNPCWNFVRPQTREASLIGFTHLQTVLKLEYQNNAAESFIHHN